MEERTKSLISSFTIQYTTDIRGYKVLAVGVTDTGPISTDKKKMTAFLSGHHPRLGKGCPLMEIPYDVLTNICDIAWCGNSLKHVDIVSPMGTLRELPFSDVFEFQFPTYKGLWNALLSRLKNTGICLETLLETPSDNVFGCYLKIKQVYANHTHRRDEFGIYCADLFLAAVDAAGCVFGPLVATIQAMCVDQYIRRIDIYRIATADATAYTTEYIQPHDIVDDGLEDFWFEKERDCFVDWVCGITLPQDDHDAFSVIDIVSTIREVTLHNMCTFSMYEEKYRSARKFLDTIDEKETSERVWEHEKMVTLQMLLHITNKIEKKTGMSGLEYKRRFDIINNSMYL